jgi:nucleoside-diphosphate-sugar epimerase
MKTVLLTGATGNVGFETLKILLHNNNKYIIKAFEIETPKTKRLLNPYKNQVELVWGDITNRETVEKAVKDCEIIIHTAALIPPVADEFPERAEKINTGGTKNIVDAINKINPNIFLIYTSSISVYGDRVENPEITVFDKLNPSPHDFYAVTKIIAENYIKLNTINFTIFRLTAVFSPKMKPDPLMFHMPLNTQLEIVTAKDTARALVLAIEKKEYLNERIFNLGGGEMCRISYKDFLNENFKIFGLHKLDFPDNAFAEKNFHCGIYKDSHVLNRLLHFQTDTLEDHFRSVHKNTFFIKKLVTKILSKPIKKNMLKNSEPFKAIINRNLKMLNYFFTVKTYENAAH